MRSERDVVDVVREGALAMAQASIQRAMDKRGITQSELAARMRRPRSFVSKMLRGDHNLTVKTLALALAECGFELEFRIHALKERASGRRP